MNLWDSVPWDVTELSRECKAGHFHGCDPVDTGAHPALTLAFSLVVAGGISLWGPLLAQVRVMKTCVAGERKKKEFLVAEEMQFCIFPQVSVMQQKVKAFA